MGTPCADVIVVDAPGITDIRGGAGDDTLVAAADVDVISGGEGDDVIVATPEVPEVLGGEGDDEIYGDTAPESVEALLRIGAGVPSAGVTAGPYPCATPTAGDDVCYMADGTQDYHGTARAIFADHRSRVGQRQAPRISLRR